MNNQGFPATKTMIKIYYLNQTLGALKTVTVTALECIEQRE